MDEIIKLSSRGSHNYLKKLIPKEKGDSKTYKLVTEEPNIKVRYLDSGQISIMPFGGPIIICGEMLIDAKAIVKKIDYILDYGHIITFE